LTVPSPEGEGRDSTVLSRKSRGAVRGVSVFAATFPGLGAGVAAHAQSKQLAAQVAKSTHDKFVRLSIMMNATPGADVAVVATTFQDRKKVWLVTFFGKQSSFDAGRTMGMPSNPQGAGETPSPSKLGNDTPPGDIRFAPRAAAPESFDPDNIRRRAEASVRASCKFAWPCRTQAGRGNMPTKKGDRSVARLSRPKGVIGCWTLDDTQPAMLTPHPSSRFLPRCRLAR
jgi:hypothetical protein